MRSTAVVLYLVLHLTQETNASVGNCIPRKTVKYQKPSFVDTETAHGSESNPNGDDDNIYMFFTATAAEFEFYDKILVSGIAHLSAVCAYSMKNIQEVFSKGSQKGPVPEEHSPVRWVVYRGEVPVPPSAAGTDNFSRSIGYNTSSDVLDKVLQFVRDHPLMDNSVNPVGNRPVLLKRCSDYARIVAGRVTSLNKQTHDVIFPGTDDGYLRKAYSCDGEVFTVEELQLFLSPEPVRFLQLSSEKGMPSAGSPSQGAQLPISECHRYECCWDCSWARGPHCARSRGANECVLLAQQTGRTENLIQSVKYGDASSCLSVGM
ncbi:semaphorin-4E-like [Chlamydotis macqueenii]